MRDAKLSERGMTLIEVVVTAAILGIILVIGLQVFLAMFGGRELDERMRRANDACDSALEALTPHAHQFPAQGGSFKIDGDNITLGSCSDTWCDQLLIDERGTRKGGDDSSAGGTLWSSAPPAGTHVEFVRRWRVDPVPFRPDVHEITVVVMPNSESTEPLARLSTRVAERMP